jgi:dipeptidyl-peptidase-3
MASLAGRDIIYDQNYKYNLTIREALETIYKNYQGERESEKYLKLNTYLKKIWFANGIHHPFSKEKMKPEFTVEHLNQLLENTPADKFNLPFNSLSEIFEFLKKQLFDDSVAPKGVESNSNKDLILNSAVNFYENITQKEAEAFYNRRMKENPKISHGLNSKLIKENDKIKEQVWCEKELYDRAIRKIIKNLKKASEYTENTQQRKWLESLIRFYETGDLNEFNRYNISWLKDAQSNTDLINGFIETYSDPLGLKGSWESILHVRDQEATKRLSVLSKNAQWFEDNAPIDKNFKKKKVKGISARAVNVAMLGGESHPTSPLGVNLPNADWLRKEYGSKSITLQNIAASYHQSMIESGFIEEFAASDTEMENYKKYGFLADNLHTDLHECLGHGSGQLKPGVSSEDLKNYQAPLEEARADLFALYFLMDPKLIELGITPNYEVAKTQYTNYIRNGLMTQLIKIKPGKNLEQAHMQNRQLISLWCFEQGANENIIEFKIIKNKRYVQINDYEKLRKLFGKLLRTIQRVKSEGNYEKAKFLVDSYGTKVDRDIHQEVLERFSKLKIAPFTGFLNPEYQLIQDKGQIRDVKMKYSDNYAEQMMKYSENFSFLSVK